MPGRPLDLGGISIVDRERLFAQRSSFHSSFDMLRHLKRQLWTHYRAKRAAIGVVAHHELLAVLVDDDQLDRVRWTIHAAEAAAGAFSGSTSACRAAGRAPATA